MKRSRKLLGFLLSTTVLLALTSSAGASCYGSGDAYWRCSEAEDREVRLRNEMSWRQKEQERAQWDRDMQRQVDMQRQNSAIEDLRRAVEQQNFLLGMQPYMGGSR